MITFFIPKRGALIQENGESLPGRVQEYETTYKSSHMLYLLQVGTSSYKLVAIITDQNESDPLTFNGGWVGGELETTSVGVGSSILGW